MPQHACLAGLAAGCHYSSEQASGVLHWESPPCFRADTLLGLHLMQYLLWWVTLVNLMHPLICSACNT